MANRYGLEIRAAESGDAEGLAELLRGAGLPVNPRALAGRLDAIGADSGAVLLAAEWGPPTGVIAVSWAWTLAAELKQARVTTLLVDPDQRRRGVARLLLKAASRAGRAAGCGELALSAPAGADGLEAFCLATGFESAGQAYVRSLRRRGQPLEL